MEKSPRFSYLLNPQPWCAAVGSWQILQRSEMLGWALLCPSGSTYCPTHTQQHTTLLHQLLPWDTLIYTSVCLPRADIPGRSAGRSTKLYFLIRSLFRTLVLDMLTRNFDFQQCLKKSVAQIKWETCPFLSKWSSLIDLYWRLKIALQLGYSCIMLIYMELQWLTASKHLYMTLCYCKPPNLTASKHWQGIERSLLLLFHTCVTNSGTGIWGDWVCN